MTKRRTSPYSFLFCYILKSLLTLINLIINFFNPLKDPLKLKPFIESVILFFSFIRKMIYILTFFPCLTKEYPDWKQIDFVYIFLQVLLMINRKLFVALVFFCNICFDIQFFFDTYFGFVLFCLLWSIYYRYDICDFWLQFHIVQYFWKVSKYVACVLLCIWLLRR